jgi:hypothetical protein
MSNNINVISNFILAIVVSSKVFFLLIAIVYYVLRFCFLILYLLLLSISRDAI